MASIYHRHHPHHPPSPEQTLPSVSATREKMKGGSLQEPVKTQEMKLIAYRIIRKETQIQSSQTITCLVYHYPTAQKFVQAHPPLGPQLLFYDP